ncbi:MAG: hypothetical protein SGPRY_013174, partial [Prymnesium sp.]
DREARWPVLTQGAPSSLPAEAMPFLIPPPTRGPYFSPSALLASLRSPLPAPSSAEWRQSRPVGVWRGSNTGLAPTTLSSWSSNQRARLSLLSRLFPSQLDAAITAWPQQSEAIPTLTRFLRAAQPADDSWLRRH